MEAFDWSQCLAVESPTWRAKLRLVFRETRLPVATAIEKLEDLRWLYCRELARGHPSRLA